MYGFTSYSSINSMEEISFIAGTTFTQNFTVYYEDGVVPIDLTASTIVLVVCPYGQSDYKVIQKTATITDAENGTFQVVFEPSDTISLSGKYIQQPIITSFDGTVYKPAQGTVLIMPGISLD